MSVFSFIKNVGSAVLGLGLAVVALGAAIAAIPCLILSGLAGMVGIEDNTPILCVVHLPLAATAGLAALAGVGAAAAWGIDLDNNSANANRPV